MYSESIEDYIKSIYYLEKSKAVSTNDIAQHLGVAAASVTKMLKKLVEMEIIDYTSHKGAILTNNGRTTALKIIRKHRLIELFLVEILGYHWDEVHEEACRLEHHISDKFEERIDVLLKFPKYDPHGDPIPDKNGILPISYSIPLQNVEVGVIAYVARIINEDPNFLVFAEKVGLKPGSRIKLLEKNVYGGTIRFHSNGVVNSIGYDISAYILVNVVNPDEQDIIGESYYDKIT